MSWRKILIGAGSLVVLLIGVAIVAALGSSGDARPDRPRGGRRRTGPAASARPGEPRARPRRATSRPAAAPRPQRRRRAPRPVTPKEVPLLAPHRPWILVEKSDRRLTVFDGERAVKTYLAAVGRGRGDKLREGDQRTPEGLFYVCVKNPASQFTRALGLSYPSIEDARRGVREGLITPAQHDAVVRAVRQGTCPPWDTALGGEIMIHGARTGRDTTAGCIALDDDDILELYPAIELHTPVRIVP